MSKQKGYWLCLIIIGFFSSVVRGEPLPAPQPEASSADTISSHQLTLEKLVEIYLEKNYSQKIREEQLYQHKLAVENQKAAFYPTVYTNFHLPGHYYTKVDTSLGASTINEFNYLQGNLIIQETLPWNAELSLSTSVIANYFDGDEYYNTSNNIGLKFYLFKKNVPQLQYKQSTLQLEELTYTQKNQLNSELISLAELYYTTFIQKIQVEISRNNLARNERILQMAETKYRSGVIDILTLNQIELQTREMAFTLKKQEQDLDYYLQQLADMLDIEEIEDVTGEIQLFPIEPKDFTLEGNPEIKRLQSAMQEADVTCELTASQFDWHLIAGAEYNWGGGTSQAGEFFDVLETDSYTAYLGIELPLYDGKTNSRQLHQQLSAKRELEYQLQKTTRELTSRWNHLTQRIDLIHNELGLLEENVQLAKDNLDMATERLLRGEMGYAEWSQIEENYEQTQLNLISQKSSLNQYILEYYKILGINLAEGILNERW